MTIVRSPEEIEAAYWRAQKASFDASDAGETDDAADTAYGLLQWLTGNSDTDPTTEFELDTGAVPA